jgi:GDP-L-fucose synthase
MTAGGAGWRHQRVCVTGGQGFLGSRVVGRLRALGADVVSCSRRTGCDLREFDQALKFFTVSAPTIVFNCASNQGGLAYQGLYPATIFYENLLMGAYTMEAARQAGVTTYVNVIAGCAYPGDPSYDVLSEDVFEGGPMHPTVENYGATKRAAVTQARCYRRQYGFNAISLILINLYGPGDHVHPDRSHALAALLRKFYEAKRDGAPTVTVWGSGRPVREWLYVDDAAEGIVRAAERYRDVAPLNVAVGTGQTIAELAELIRTIVGYQGRIVFDGSKPDGALRKVGDVTRMRAVLDWEPSTPLREGIRRTLQWLAAHDADLARADA